MSDCYKCPPSGPCDFCDPDPVAGAEGLTEQEYEAICDASWRGGSTAWRAAIGDVLAARTAALRADLDAALAKVAAVEALADELESKDVRSWRCARDLRAALDGDPR